MIDLKEEKQKRIDLASAQQRQASNPELSVWVEASAGTGKTKVLSDRVLRVLLEGNLPGKILCLTYTKAAAVEMSSRIADKLSKWAVASDEVLCGELMKLLGIENVSAKLMAQARRLFAVLLDTPGGMKIQTIHSFCQEILKRFPLEAKISPYFEVMDDVDFSEQFNADGYSDRTIYGNTDSNGNINSYTLPGKSGMASTRYGTLSCFTYNDEETKALVREHFTEFDD